MLSAMNEKKIYRIGSFLLKIGSLAIGFVFALLATFKDLLTNDEPVKANRPIQDSDLIGDYNFRTERFDAGTDPDGWYEDDL